MEPNPVSKTTGNVASPEVRETVPPDAVQNPPYFGPSAKIFSELSDFSTKKGLTRGMTCGG